MIPQVQHSIVGCDKSMPNGLTLQLGITCQRGNTVSRNLETHLNGSLLGLCAMCMSYIILGQKISGPTHKGECYHVIPSQYLLSGCDECCGGAKATSVLLSNGSPKGGHSKRHGKKAILHIDQEFLFKQILLANRVVNLNRHL